MQVRKQFPFGEFEPRWQRYWLENATFKAANPGEAGSEKPKFYALDMFPYPSGAGLHVGHPEGYTATDIISRYKRMRGYNVLHPIGWDAFGLPAEQYAINTGTHPRITTEKNIATFRRQIQSLGFSYDWSREVDTTDPAYYKWTQWLFIQLYKKGLAYVSNAPVWYCPDLGTVLANEEVLPTPEGPRSERGNFPVEKRPLRQWMLRITAYAERLLTDLEALDWPESLKEMQRNWIGRSEGAEVTFRIHGHDEAKKITVFTTRPDTLFGVTYLVLAPEHALVDEITTAYQRGAVDEYKKQILSKSDLDRTDLAKEKTGVFTGAFGVHPVSGKQVPIWIADYVLISYGTGAIMAVPGHDERDFEFAKQFALPILEVVSPTEPTGERVDQAMEKPFCNAGYNMNSVFLDGLPTESAKSRMIEWLEGNQAGTRRIQYRLRDWLFSRQRYWGEPFPIVWKTGPDGVPQHEPISENELPLRLPEMEDFKPSPEGKAPLAKATDWLNVAEGVTRETNTMPQWAGSCWYYLRYCDPKNSQAFVSPEAERYWLGEKGVDLYVGGAEQAVLHLLYARFWHKVFFDMGLVSGHEPFKKLVNQGIILGEDGEKMSKQKGNVINPDSVVEEYGADALRLFEMFMGPLEQVKPWSTKGVDGVYGFLGRVWRLVMEEQQDGSWKLAPAKLTDEPGSQVLLRRLHQTIQKVTNDIEKLRFNTAIAALMVLVNDLTKESARPRGVVQPLLLLLAPFAPHIAEELWSQLGNAKTLAYEPWPEVDPAMLIEETMEIPVQVNGKVRGVVTVPADADQAVIEEAARGLETVTRWLEGETVKEVRYVPKRLLNFTLVKK